jgi:protein ImuA
MSRHSSRLRPEVQETVQELRRHLGLFSFHDDVSAARCAMQQGLPHQLGVRAGSIVEYLAAKEGAGAATCALQLLAQSSGGREVHAVVDSAREFYAPALSGWGIDPGKTLLVRPANLRESCWAIEQCLRCPGVSATWAWVKERIPERVHRRWQLAAEAGGGVGLFFRPALARREPVWADLRLLVTPRTGGQEESRRVHIEVLYRRGGFGGGPQAWEIDHAVGIVRLVPEVAHPATSKRAARA